MCTTNNIGLKTCTNEGTSTELMPCIMGMFDTIVEEGKRQPSIATKKTFTHLSPGVKNLLSHVTDQSFPSTNKNDENSKKISQKSFLNIKNNNFNKSFKSNESLDIISPNIQKMLSNLPDTELIIPSSHGHGDGDGDEKKNRSFLYYNNVTDIKSDNNNYCDDLDNSDNNNEKNYEQLNSDFVSNQSDSVVKPVPLGSYLHTSPHGIASRTPVGRKSLKYLQIPSESSIGTVSTNSSEVSRPVSLTSIGSCSSSGSSGKNQNGSAYLASAESLDSDPEPSGSQGSADSGIAEQPSIITAEMRVLQEVLDSETVYVKDLKQVIEGYLKPWRLETNCILAQHLDALFSNIEEIYEFNRKFLEQLKKAEGDSTKIANTFLQNDSGFSVYHEYCTNYPRTMDVISELTRNERIVPEFKEKQMALGHALPLGSYLLKPVQRILKYHLLLQRLSKQCEPQHKHVVDLALTTMTGIASDINMMKRKHEHAVRVQEIQSQLYGWTGPDLNALGELIAEGTFRVVGARGRRHVFLFDKVFLMAKSKHDGVLAYKFHIMCSNLMLVEQVRGEPLSFQVIPFDNPRLQCTLRARSPQHKREWTLQIKRVILENYSAVIPNHARQLVMQLGQDISEIEQTEKWTPLKHSSNTPHYLERRSRIRKTVDSKRRAASQDRSFPTLNWRRKSEPGFIPQFNNPSNTTISSKLTTKKPKTSSKFYADISDSENFDVATTTESTDSLVSKDHEFSSCELNDETARKMNLEQIVSDIVNEEFKKLKRNKRTIRDSEPSPTLWFEDSPPKLPTKADSLPRSFLLNEQGGSDYYHKHILEKSLKENPNGTLEDQHENDLTSHIDDSEHPDHKIYRKSAIRVSLLHRIRNLMSEQQKKSSSRNLSSKNSTGERIANPDYVDPQKFFLNSSRNSLLNITTETDILLQNEPERLDMTINENDVLNEIEHRLQKSISLDSEKVHLKDDSSQNSENIKSSTVATSQEEDYYEAILDENLVEEFVKDENGIFVLKQDSFRSVKSHQFEIVKTSNLNERKIIKRPNKAPPPIPVKPLHLLNGDNKKRRNKNEVKTENQEPKSWVKTMVGRFE